MKTLSRLLIFLILLVALLIPATAYAGGVLNDRIVFGGTFTLQSGETLEGSLVVFGGNATLEEGSRVTRDVLLMGGNLQVDGTVQGNIAAFGGLVDLTRTAVVNGNITLFGSQLERDPQAQVLGEVLTNQTGPFSFQSHDFTFPTVFSQIPFRTFGLQLSPLASFAWFMFRVFLWAILAVLVILFLPAQSEQIAQTAVHQPLLSLGVGLLTILVLPPLLILLAITICFSPISLIGALGLALAWAFGLISLGLEVGKRIARLSNQEWALPLSTSVGTFVLILVINGVGALIPCVGWLLPLFTGMLGLGAVLLTRFGTQAYPPVVPPPSSALLSQSPAGDQPPPSQGDQS